MHRRSGRIIGGALAVAVGLLTAMRPSLGDVNVDKLPNPTGYVSDLANVVAPTQKQQLEEFCTRVEQELGVQIALVTVDSVGDQPIRDVALNLSRKWGVGSKKGNQGVLLLLAIKDHKSDIETGRGVEPYLTDGFSGGTLRAMRPQLRTNEYGPALLTAAHSMAAQIAQGKGLAFSDTFVPPLPDDTAAGTRHGSGGGIPFSLIVLGIFFLVWLLGRGGRGRGGPYRGGGGGGGFLTGMILGNLLGGGRGGGGNWGGGGGFGGGDSGGGGGGFGGFGGGDFGGGGASSDW